LPVIRFGPETNRVDNEDCLIFGFLWLAVYNPDDKIKTGVCTMNNMIFVEAGENPGLKAQIPKRDGKKD
jgi:hypothetical protein